MRIPGHVAIIMDGNRRWASERSLPVIEGHRAGAEAARRAIRYCRDYGVQNLTLYAFSTENWLRPQDEIEGLFNLLSVFFNKYIDELTSKGIRLSAIGRLEKLPDYQKRIIDKAVKKTSGNKDFHLVIAINYGGRAEIADAAARIAQDAVDGRIHPSDVNEDMFRNYLYCPDCPDPDLLIRTGGQMRISNFLLWQISYAEIHVRDVLWPDFSEKDFSSAIEDYSKRERRFGGR